MNGNYQAAFPIAFDRECQRVLERSVDLVLNDTRIALGDATMHVKHPGDEQIVADVVADQIHSETAREVGALFVSEERHTTSLAELTLMTESKPLVFVCDPIDGSSEFSRIGVRRSPLSTAILAVRDGAFVAGAVGDIWGGEVFGLDCEDNGEAYLVVRRRGTMDRQRVAVDGRKRLIPLSEARVAAYAPSRHKSRFELIGPLFDRAEYVHNNGGQLFALRVVEGRSVASYTAALELVPVPLWEHIGPILAVFANASVCRVDGRALELNPQIAQTSITAASENLNHELQDALWNAYATTGIQHRQPVTR